MDAIHVLGAALAGFMQVADMAPPPAGPLYFDPPPRVERYVPEAPLTRPRITLLVETPDAGPVVVMPDAAELMRHYRVVHGAEAQVMPLPGAQVMLRFAPEPALCSPLRTLQPRRGEAVYTARYPVVGQLVITGAIVDGVEIPGVELYRHFERLRYER